MRTYKLNEIFLSLQGEGVRAGTPNVFVKFAGCNLACSRDVEGFDCDTDLATNFSMEARGILENARAMGKGCRNVVFTGGEPGLQLSWDLTRRFKFDEPGWYVAVETNGTQELPEGIDWIAVSPKTPTSRLRINRASEVRYVLRHGDPLPENDARYFDGHHSPVLADTSMVNAPIYTVSPAFDGDLLPPRNLAWCVDLVRMNPRWRLSVQQQRGWKIGC